MFAKLDILIISLVCRWYVFQNWVTYVTCVYITLLQVEIFTSSDSQPKLTSPHDTKAILKHVSNV